jgi:hypothetical protein
MIKHPCCLAALAGLLTMLGTTAAQPPALQVKSEDDRIVVTRRAGDLVLAVHNVRKDFRPYLHPLQAPDGKGVLTEFSPSHHKHQTGLYWGFTRVNGRDYFHNPGGDYWQLHEKRVLESTGTQAKWQTVYDLLGADKKPALTETQTWTLTDGGDHYTLDLEWRGKAVSDVVFGKYDYGGLFLRMPWTSKTGGQAVNSEGETGGQAEGKRARWVDVGMPVQGRDDWAHIVIMDHPRNDGHPLPWRVDGQLGVGPVRARLGEWKLAASETATIRYRMLVYTGKTDKDRVEASWKAFAR